MSPIAIRAYSSHTTRQQLLFEPVLRLRVFARIEIDYLVLRRNHRSHHHRNIHHVYHRIIHRLTHRLIHRLIHRHSHPHPRPPFHKVSTRMRLKLVCTLVFIATHYG